MKFERFTREIISEEEVFPFHNSTYAKLKLACGHLSSHEKLSEGYNVFVGVSGKDTVFIGDSVECWDCFHENRKAVLLARPTQKIKVFPTEEAVSGLGSEVEWGPVHKHDGKLYLQVYLGQHEWLAVSVKDTLTSQRDPGWEGTIYGYGVISREEIRHSIYMNSDSEEIGPPEREGKPLVGDWLLFASPEKLKDYLGEEDPIFQEKL